MKPVLDVHTHTIASGHAYNTINEMIASAKEKGLTLLGITDHGPRMQGSCDIFYFYNMKVLSREKMGIRVLFGCEMNIIDMDGNVDLDCYALEQLDIGIASMHPPCMEAGTREENTNAYLRAMRNPKVHIIGHPDDSRFPVDMKRLVLGAKENHVLLEVNNGSLNPKGFRENTEVNDREMLAYCMEYQVPVILGSDAHVEEEVGDFARGIKLLESMNFPEELVMNYSQDKFLTYLGLE